MKLFRYGAVGQVKTGVCFNDTHYDVTAFGEEFGEKFFETNGLERLATWLKAQPSLAAIAEPITFAAPFTRPNYSDHAKETGASIPKEPILFFKATSALSGPNDDVIIPKGSTKTDWEVELAIVIGKKASHVSEEEALQYIAGYCVHNDYSEREFQLERGGQWVKGKSCDTFAPMGPYLVTKDEVADVGNLRLWLSVNDQQYQNGNTSNLIFNVPYLVSYISQFMTLLPGDVISTGTPAGVGLGFNPPIYLKAGDVVTLGIEGLGEQKQVLKAFV
jgi:2,4-diketo-3-deoxy-L-fuconate hydrolase